MLHHLSAWWSTFVSMRSFESEKGMRLPLLDAALLSLSTRCFPYFLIIIKAFDILPSRVFLGVFYRRLPSYDIVAKRS